MWPASRGENAGGLFADDAPDASAPPRIGRFRLEDQILGSHGQRLWRAFDERLNRMVALRLIDPDDSMHDELRIAACAAARVVDRRVVQVLDVLDHDGILVIVTEWIDAIPLEQLLTTSMSPAQAVEVTRRVAEAITHIHAAGVTHGRLRPATVMIDSEGEVRVRGHMIDARIYGIEPGSDPAAADISGLGAIMTACLTGRWPGNTPTALPTVPVVAGKRALPSQLRADLPGSLDSFVIRAMAAAPCPEVPVTNHPFSTAAAAIDALTGTYEGSDSLRHLHRRPRLTRLAKVSARGGTRAPSRVKRAALLVGIVAAAFTIGITSAKLIFSDEAAPSDAVIGGPAQNANQQGTEADNNRSTRVQPVPANLEQVLPVAAVMELRPNGKGISRSTSPQATIDDNATTVWRTPMHDRSTVSSRAAGGVIIDLGEVRQVSAVNIGLLGNNNSVELRTSERLGNQVSKYQLLHRVDGAGTAITLREARPLATRYLLIALTSVPKATGDNYQGGISSIQVLG